jgi:Xaa-Pro dipeptidase
MTDWKSLFAAHIAHCRALADDTLARLGLDGVVIGSGSLGYYFEDDNAYVPSIAPLLVLVPASRRRRRRACAGAQAPRLHLYAPSDYWYEHADFANPFWAGEFEVELHGDPGEHLEGARKACAHGLARTRRHTAREAGLQVSNAELTARLNWGRSFQEPEYELACTRAATRTGGARVIGPRAPPSSTAARTRMSSRVLAAADAVESELPYPTIVALDEKAAVLHYHGKRRAHRSAAVLLIDAGTQHHGYACDITRTHCSSARRRSPAVGDLEARSRNSAPPAAGYTFMACRPHASSTWRASCSSMGSSGTADEATAIDAGSPAIFLPHGIGHLLGLHVHDVAGKQSDPVGTPIARIPHVFQVPAFPYRTMAPGCCSRSGPASHFIDVLLAQRQGRPRCAIDWNQVERCYRPPAACIEDNVCVTAAGHESLHPRAAAPQGRRARA